ncbi:unnamed protein product, partial [Rotaria socialis]
DKISSISEQNKDGSLPVLQIDPLTLINSISSFNRVDDNHENILESACVSKSQSESNDVNTSLSEKFDQIRIKKSSLTTHMDEHSIAAWVKSTTVESAVSSIERSPSLPSTIIEQITNSRRASTVSTICDTQQQQQISACSDTLSSTLSQNASVVTDVQRSFSFPATSSQHQFDDDEENQFVQVDQDDDYSSQFLPVPESEDSEIDKVEKKASIEEPIEFHTRSPTEKMKKSSEGSPSLEVRRKSLSNRKRNNSWNTNKNNLLLYQKSQSQKISSQPPYLKSRIVNNQYPTNHSLSPDTKIFPSDRK